MALVSALLRRYHLWPPRWWPWAPSLVPTRLAVGAYIVPKPDPSLPGQYLPDWNGQPRDWAWVLRQWDRIAHAGSAVRLVVAEQSYTDVSGTQLTDLATKLNACRNAGQIVCGYVSSDGGTVPLLPPAPPAPPNSWWFVPRDPFTQQLTGPATAVPANTLGARKCVRDQIDEWRNAFPEIINGIYVDEGPMDCLQPRTLGGDAHIPSNYADYCQYIRQFGYQVFLLAPQYDDQDPNQIGWLRALPWDFLGLWENDVPTYTGKFNAWNVCLNSFTSWPPGAPDASWWDPALVGGTVAMRTSRVNIINGGAQIQGPIPTLFGPIFFPDVLGRMYTILQLSELMVLAMSRGAATVWITEAGRDPVRGSVYDQLPPYWDDEVALCS